jgi:hypothetical protein
MERFMKIIRSWAVLVVALLILVCLLATGSMDVTRLLMLLGFYAAWDLAMSVYCRLGAPWCASFDGYSLILSVIAAIIIF